MLLVVIFLCIVWCLISIEPPAQELAIEGEDPATLMPAPAEGPSDRRLAAMAALIGLLAAAGTLTRYSFGWLILPIIFHFLVFFPLRRVTLCLAALLAFSITLAPWLTRNYQLSGALFGAQGYAIVQGTSEFPDNRLERSLSPDLSRIQLEDYFRKFITHSRQIIEDGLPKLGGSWITAFFLVGLMIPFKSPTISRLRIFIVLNLVVLIVVQALGWTHLSADSPVVNSENLLVLVSPLVFIYGSGMFHLLLDQLDLAFPQARRLAIGLFWLVASAPLLFTLLPPRANPVAYPPYFPPRIQESSKWMKESELMMSDVPWAVAWYGRRNCLWLTLDVKHDFYSLNDYQAPVQAIYLTQLTTDAHFVSQVINGEDWAWGRFVMDSLLRTNAPPGFPLKSAPSGFLPEQFFLTDRPRWTLQNE